MRRRPHRITFRLSPEEFAKFRPLIMALHAWTWSDLIRTGLRKLHAEEEKRTSDNGVRQKGLLPVSHGGGKSKGWGAAKKGDRKPGKRLVKSR